MRILLLLVFAFFLASCADEQASPAEPGDEPEIQFREDGSLTFYRPDEGDIVTIPIEIAETPRAIERGLMGRDRFPRGKGMLFLMPRTEILSFWMANTPISLDITFVSPDSTVINTAKYTRPYSHESHSSQAPARFVIETRAGFTDSHGIVSGDRVRWTRR